MKVKAAAKGYPLGECEPTLDLGYTSMKVLIVFNLSLTQNYN